MYNYYDFEAEFPLEKATQKFLVSDYFHDSRIQDIKMDHRKHELIIRLQCCRDWETANMGSLDEVQYTYFLRFSGVYGFRAVTELQTSEYINGRFKQTAWLNEQQQRTKRKLYQFRIGLSDGYIDLIFCSFTIRKAVGRVFYRDVDELGAFYKEWYRQSPEQIREIMNELQADASDLMSDMKLEFLYANEVKDLRALCQNIITGEASPDAKVYAAWLLGKRGAKEDLQLIWDVYRTEAERIEYEFGSDDSMKYRNLLDAIENLNGCE